MDMPKGYSQASAAYENQGPAGMSSREIDVLEEVKQLRSEEISDMRNDLLEKLNVQECEVDFWEGDYPEDPGETDTTDEGHFPGYSWEVSVIVHLNDGRSYELKEGWDWPRFLSCIHSVESV